jgi:hypothetical protein
MRAILIEQARRKGSRKRGGGARRVELSKKGLALIEPPADDLLVPDQAIERLRGERPHLAEVGLLRYYAGLSVGSPRG